MPQTTGGGIEPPKRAKPTSQDRVVGGVVLPSFRPAVQNDLQQIALRPPQPTQAEITAQLNLRAASLPTDQVIRHPDVAAHLVTSPIPTPQLPTVLAVYDQGMSYVDGQTATAGVPGAMKQAYQLAYAISDPSQRAVIVNALNTFIQNAKNGVPVDPADVQRFQDWFAQVVQSDDATKHMPFGRVLKNTGLIFATIFGAPLGGLGSAAPAVVGGVDVATGAAAVPALVEGAAATANAARLGLAFASIQEASLGVGGIAALGSLGTGKIPVVGPEVSHLIDRVRTDVGQAWGDTGKILGGAARVGSGLVAFGAGELYDPLENPITKFGRYVPSWNELKTGDLPIDTGFGALFHDITGLDPAKYSGAYEIINTFGDVLTFEGVARGAMQVRNFRLTPEAFGGRFSGEAFVQDSSLGGRIVNKVWQTVDNTPLAGRAEYLRQSFKDMRPQLADELARAGTRDDVARIIASHFDSVPTPEAIASVQDELATVKGDIAKGGNEYVLTSLRVRAVALEQQLTDLVGRQADPSTLFPRPARMAAIVNNLPASLPLPLKFVEWLYRGAEKVVDLKKLDDGIVPRDRILWNRAVPEGLPPDWAFRGSEYLRKIMDTAGVEKGRALSVISDYRQIASRADYFDWRNELSNALRDGLGKKALTPEGMALVRWSEQDATDAAGAGSYFEPKVGADTLQPRPVVRGTDEMPKPSMETEYAGHSLGPDPALVRRASSSIRYYDQLLKTMPVWGKVYGALSVPFEVARYIGFTIPRMVLKPLVLIGSVFPILLKKEIDDSLRNVALGMKPYAIGDRLSALPGGIPVSGVADAVAAATDIFARLEQSTIDALPKDRFGNPDYQSLGITWGESDVQTMQAVARALDAGIEKQYYFQSTKGLDFTRDSSITEQVAMGTWERLSNLSKNDSAKLVARFGPEGAYQYILDHPLSDAAKWWADESAILDKHGISPQEFFANKETEIQQATGGSAAYRQAIYTHQLEVPGGPLTSGQEMEIAMRLQEIDTAASAEQRLLSEGDRVGAAEMARRIEELGSKVNRLRSQPETPSTIDLADSRAVTGQVLTDWGQGNYDMPDMVRVERSFLRPDPTGMTRMDRWLADRNGKMAAFNSRLYKGLGIISKAELALTRGSSYFQMADRIFTQLTDAGMSEEAALRVAQYRGAFQTADLHYNLLDRSSFESATRDVLWFAPVYRQILQAWLWDIPSQSYWALGLAARGVEAGSLLNNMEKLGLIKKDDTGALQIAVPFGFMGNQINIHLGGLFHITGQHLYPDVSPGMEELLQLGKSIAPNGPAADFIGQLSKMFTYDHGESGVNWMPSVVKNGLEMVGIHIPTDTMNPTAWRNAGRIAQTKAIQLAMSQLEQDGITAPPPGSPPELMAKYRAEVMARASSLETGSAMATFFAHILFPAASLSNDPVGDAYHSWLAKQGIVYPFTPEDYTKIDAYVGQHPEALPYTIGRYSAATNPMLPDNAPYADKLAAGDITPLSGDAYYIKAIAVMGLKAEESRLRTELSGVGITTAADRLRNGVAYNSVYNEHVLRMSEWLYQNPEVAAYLEKRSSFSADNQLLLDANRALRALTAQGYFQNPDQASALKTIRGVIGQAEADSIPFGPAGNAEQAAYQKWWDKMTPYYDKIDSLQQEATKLFAADPHSALGYGILDEIRSMQDSVKRLTINGERMPTPEEVQWGGMTQKQQDNKILDWSIGNPLYLSQFRLSQVGYPDFRGRVQLTATLNAINTLYATQRYGPGSEHLTDAQKAALDQQHITNMERAGALYGPAGVEFARFALPAPGSTPTDYATPAMRMSYTGFGHDNLYWNVLSAQAQDLIRYAQGQGANPQYASTAAGVFQRKVEFERRITFLRSIDPAFDRLVREAANTFATPYNGDTPKLGVPLYEQLFFGQTANDYNYQDPLILAVEQNNPYYG